MSLSNIVEGKANSIALSGGGAQTEPPQYLGSAPVFARPGEPEPNCVVGERLQPPQARPHREASRTLVEAREYGLSMPEALDLTPDEIAAGAGVPPESPPDRRRRPKRASKSRTPAEGFGACVGLSHLRHLGGGPAL
jgi:hypothetical protein